LPRNVKKTKTLTKGAAVDGHTAEAVNNLDIERESEEVFMKFAETHSMTKKRPVAEIIESGNALYPDFTKRLKALCQ
jgi:hypothetical protein